jgi:hypothetical protein
MLTIITPCSRPQNLKKIYESIQFDKIHQWIIVHDTTKTRGIYNPVFTHPKIIEYGHVSPPGTCSGNSQRNAGLIRVNEGMIYFLDDDNIVHPTVWTLLTTFDEDHYYTWDQIRNDQFANKPGGILGGEEPRLRKIDTAQYIVPRHMCRPWQEGPYWADGLFIEDIYERYKDRHVYIPTIAAYYNYLTM